VTNRSRRLVVLRHAQAESAAPSDAERPLSDRGRRDARAAGEWLSGLDLHALAPDGAALVSSALRTRQTYEALATGAGWEAQASYDEALYAAGPDAALDLVRATADATTALLLVGHNPTMGILAQLLDDGEGDLDATTALAGAGFPTCAAAVFAVTGPWDGLGAYTARLEAFHVARG